MSTFIHLFIDLFIYHRNTENQTEQVQNNIHFFNEEKIIISVNNNQRVLVIQIYTISLRQEILFHTNTFNSLFLKIQGCIILVQRWIIITCFLTSDKRRMHTNVCSSKTHVEHFKNSCCSTSDIEIEQR